MVHMVSPLSRGLFQGAILQSPGVPTARETGLVPLTGLRGLPRSELSPTRAQSVLRATEAKRSRRCGRLYD